jgi:hypothetical protein
VSRNLRSLLLVSLGMMLIGAMLSGCTQKSGRANALDPERA